MNEPFDDTQGKQLDRIEAKLAEVYTSVEKTRKYILWTAIVTAAVILIPLLILPAVIPSFLASQGIGL